MPVLSLQVPAKELRNATCVYWLWRSIYQEDEYSCYLTHKQWLNNTCTIPAAYEVGPPTTWQWLMVKMVHSHVLRFSYKFGTGMNEIIVILIHQYGKNTGRHHSQPSLFNLSLTTLPGGASWGTTAATRVPRLRIGECPREWTRG